MLGFGKSLFKAIEDKKWAKAEKLIREKKGITLRDESGRTPLHIAVGHSGDKALNVVRLLIENGADINARDGRDRTPLYMVASHGDLSIVIILLESGADLEIRAKSEWMSNCGNGRGVLDAMQTILNNRKNNNFILDSPFERAVRGGDTEIIKLMIRHGAKPSLFSSVMLNDADKAKEILSNGFPVDQRDNMGSTALHLAAEEGLSDMVKILLEAGADVSLKNPSGHSPLRLTLPKLGSCSRSGPSSDYDRTVELLVKYGAKPEDVGTAAVVGDVGFIEKALDDGFNVNQVLDDELNEALIHIASSWGRVQVVKLLIERGAELNEMNFSWSTPLDLAEAYKNKAVAKFLKEHGAKHNDEKEIARVMDKMMHGAEH